MSNHVRGYYGVAEIAAACGVSKQAVANWRKREKCPRPAVILKMGPVWVLNNEVMDFIRSKGGKI